MSASYFYFIEIFNETHTVNDRIGYDLDHYPETWAERKVKLQSLETTPENLSSAVMMKSSVNRVKSHIFEHIVHPAHVPLEVETKTAVARRLCYHRP